jgi:lysophospholipid acyltransferase (LPLAT)-like uncharacterized protein
MELKYEAVRLAVPFCRLLELTCRIKQYNYTKPETSVIYAIWHGLQNYLGGVPGRENIHILISPSVDGETIARIVQAIGFSTVRGSSKRDGAKATREIISLLENGKNVVYAVDGPKGPHGKVKDGLIRIAQMAQKPIVPISAAANFKKAISSWDRYEIIFPFAKTPIVFGEPIHVPRDLSDEEVEKYKLQIENDLLRLREDACAKL